MYSNDFTMLRRYSDFSQNHEIVIRTTVLRDSSDQTLRRLFMNNLVALDNEPSGQTPLARSNIDPPKTKGAGATIYSRWMNSQSFVEHFAGSSCVQDIVLVEVTHSHRYGSPTVVFVVRVDALTISQVTDCS